MLSIEYVRVRFLEVDVHFTRKVTRCLQLGDPMPCMCESVCVCVCVISHCTSDSLFMTPYLPLSVTNYMFSRHTTLVALSSMACIRRCVQSRDIATDIQSIPALMETISNAGYRCAWWESFFYKVSYFCLFWRWTRV